MADMASVAPGAGLNAAVDAVHAPSWSLVIVMVAVAVAAAASVLRSCWLDGEKGAEIEPRKAEQPFGRFRRALSGGEKRSAGGSSGKGLQPMPSAHGGGSARGAQDSAAQRAADKYDTANCEATVRWRSGAERADPRELPESLPSGWWSVAASTWRLVIEAGRRLANRAPASLAAAGDGHGMAQASPLVRRLHGLHRESRFADFEAAHPRGRLEFEAPAAARADGEALRGAARSLEESIRTAATRAPRKARGSAAGISSNSKVASSSQGSPAARAAAGGGGGGSNHGNTKPLWSRFARDSQLLMIFRHVLLLCADYGLVGAVEPLLRLSSRHPFGLARNEEPDAELYAAVLLACTRQPKGDAEAAGVTSRVLDLLLNQRSMLNPSNGAHRALCDALLRALLRHRAALSHRVGAALALMDRHGFPAPKPGEASGCGSDSVSEEGDEERGRVAGQGADRDSGWQAPAHMFAEARAVADEHSSQRRRASEPHADALPADTTQESRGNARVTPSGTSQSASSSSPSASTSSTPSVAETPGRGRSGTGDSVDKSSQVASATSADPKAAASKAPTPAPATGESTQVAAGMSSRRAAAEPEVAARKGKAARKGTKGAGLEPGSSCAKAAARARRRAMSLDSADSVDSTTSAAAAGSVAARSTASGRVKSRAAVASVAKQEAAKASSSGKGSNARSPSKVVETPPLRARATPVSATRPASRGSAPSAGKGAPPPGHISSLGHKGPPHVSPKSVTSLASPPLPPARPTVKVSPPKVVSAAAVSHASADEPSPRSGGIAAPAPGTQPLPRVTVSVVARPSWEAPKSPYVSPLLTPTPGAGGAAPQSAPGSSGSVGSAPGAVGVIGPTSRGSHEFVAPLEAFELSPAAMGSVPAASDGARSLTAAPAPALSPVDSSTVVGSAMLASSLRPPPGLSALPLAGRQRSTSEPLRYSSVGEAEVDLNARAAPYVPHVAGVSAAAPLSTDPAMSAPQRGRILAQHHAHSTSLDRDVETLVAASGLDLGFLE